ncbi:MAG: hypothetical protein KGN77_14355 [Xanthomonadaceae bacterium]|nr:hypothetical protein [Xanthomonadaceae bacterium]MDE1963181.1 hypothetical protein [Xanthomonadaceae bacterium]
MKLLLSLALGLVALSGCSTPPRRAGGQAPQAWITPVQAVILAADAAPRGVRATFAMRVRSTGAQGDRIFLNSQPDYRDQRDLTIVIGPRVAEQLQERLGADPRVALKGRDIRVTGWAVRTKIYFFANGEMTDKYYYQTHVNLIDAGQLILARQVVVD